MSERKPLKYNPGSGDIEQFRNDDEVSETVIATPIEDVKRLIGKLVCTLEEQGIDIEDEELLCLKDLID